MNPRPNGSFDATPRGDVLTITREFPASIDDVWAALTTSDRLARWIGTFTGDPHRGHVEFTMTAEGAENEVPQRWDVVRCEPPNLLEVRTAGGWYLIAELAEADGVTTLAFGQVVDDPSVIGSVGPGWEYYLDRLVAVADGADASAVDFDDYFPAQEQYYAGLVTRGTTPADSR